MRQLLAQGWMHNRVRMITASFLTKDLHVWWPVGARHFLEHLVDGDIASNNHGWQWVAGTGTDASPYFRVFNPVTQGLRFDPDGDYVRRWVPELAHLPGAGGARAVGRRRRLRPRLPASGSSTTRRSASRRSPGSRPPSADRRARLSRPMREPHLGTGSVRVMVKLPCTCADHRMPCRRSRFPHLGWGMRPFRRLVGTRGVLPKLAPVSTSAPRRTRCGAERPEPVGEGDLKTAVRLEETHVPLVPARRRRTRPRPSRRSAPPLLWGVTIGAIVVLFVVDFLITRRPHEVSMKEAVGWSAFYVAIPLAFGVWIWQQYGGDRGLEYYTGYLVEKSLSVDNLFVFLLLLTAFAVPRELQQRVLLIGVAGALVLRGIFIALGAQLIASFSWAFLLFGAVLLVTAVKVRRDALSPDDHTVDIGSLRTVRLLRRFWPVTESYAGTRMTVRQAGRRALTPLALVVVAILGTDVVFAIDSVPAVYGITGDPYLVFATNAFALLGLRALYFVVEGALGLAAPPRPRAGRDPRLHRRQARPALGATACGRAVPEVPTLASLGVIVGILALVTTTSLLANRRDERRDAGATAEDVERRAEDRATQVDGPTRSSLNSAAGKPGPSLPASPARSRRATSRRPPAGARRSSLVADSDGRTVAARPCAAAPSSVSSPWSRVWRVAPRDPG